MMNIYELLEQGTGMKVVYAHYNEVEGKPVKPPYLSYIGSGQSNFEADDTYFYSRNQKQLEYYFTKKSIQTETKIENVLLENGLLYTKSDDVYIEDQGVFVIYYNF